jgi:hypothetical protein
MSDREDGATRRRLLARLGLAAGAAYAAPSLIGMDTARASGPSRRQGSRPSRPSAPSRPSRPSRPIRPLR